MQLICAAISTIILLISPGLHSCPSFRFCPNQYSRSLPRALVYLLPTWGKSSKQVMQLVQSSVCSDWPASTCGSCFKRGMLPALSLLGCCLEPHFTSVKENQYSSDFFPCVKFSRRCLMSSKLLAVARSGRQKNIAWLFLTKPNSEGR